MLDFLSKLFSSDFMPHGMCYLWRPDILWLHAITDSLIALAYFSIPLSLAYFVRKRKDLPFNWIFVMFGVFILSCGSTHIMEVWTLWNGTYRLSGLIKVITAAASVATAIAMFPLMPRALALPSPEALQAEIAERRRIEIDLQNAQAELERRVEQRTHELARANEELQTEIIGRKKLEEQMRQAHKMEALGRLAGGVAHDFNNLLMAIGGYNLRVLEQVAEGTPAHLAAQQVEKASQQAAQLTMQLLAFSRKQVLRSSALDVNVAVSEMSQLLLPLLPESIQLSMQPAPSPAWVLADAGQMQQVILNLALNARDAMPDGGRLHIEVSNIALEAEAAAERNLPAAGDYALLQVSDTGQGITSVVRAHMFEPFFTTKAPGAGTGLGLSIVYGVVHQSGGAIHVTSEPGQGTTVAIYLPRSVEPAMPPAAAPHVARVSRGETVLLVDDVALVRALVKDLLSEAGYQVLEAADGNEALAISARHDGAIDLLLTDLAMPGMNGQQLARELNARRPGIKILFMSAYPPESAQLSGVAAETFLQKPFNPDDLHLKIRRTLAS